MTEDEFHVSMYNLSYRRLVHRFVPGDGSRFGYNYRTTTNLEFETGRVHPQSQIGDRVYPEKGRFTLG